jgi:hypothetical protein
MNKTQKKNLVKQRRFHQQVCKKTKHLISVDIETRGLEWAPASPPEMSVDTDVIRKLTLKELEYLIENGQINTRRYAAYVGMAQDAIKNELAERRLLLAK